MLHSRESAQTPEPTVVDPEGSFARNYNRTDFMFEHRLTGHPLFELPSLVELSKRLPDNGENYWSNGKVAVNNSWSAGTSVRQSIQDTIVNIEHNDSIVILKHTEQDPIYAPILQNVLATLIDLSGERMRSDVIVGEVLILISSPGRITPYHMDAEVNFLLQVTGDKWFHIFDHADRDLVTAQELEKFYAVSRNIAVYRADRQNDCEKYDLHAGYGVHLPVCAPHWVQNRDNVSVALSVNYELRSIGRLEKVHRFNRRLRGLGVDPSIPGNNVWGDRLKLTAERSIATVRSLIRPRVKPSYGVWRPAAR
ncbi:MAG TPA: hypothetical protein VK727_13420 [Steroidobacteraceae bacterium]|jgi:hypothetical protein|nr:hypothetical protein [Steroidobacteraceae bacterium]